MAHPLAGRPLVLHDESVVPGQNGLVEDEAYHAGRHLAFGGDDGQALHRSGQHGPAPTSMPDIALGTEAERRAKREGVTAAAMARHRNVFGVVVD